MTDERELPGPPEQEPATVEEEAGFAAFLDKIREAVKEVVKSD